jgi:hypothetical protein
VTGSELGSRRSFLRRDGKPPSRKRFSTRNPMFASGISSAKGGARAGKRRASAAGGRHSREVKRKRALWIARKVGLCRSAWGQSRRFCDVCFSVRYPQYRTFTSDWDWPACRLAAPELQTTGAAAAAPAFCPRPAKRHELHLRSTKTRHINCAKSTRKLLASCLSWFLSDGGLANDSAGPARRRQPTA